MVDSARQSSIADEVDDCGTEPALHGDSLAELTRVLTIDICINNR